MNKDLIPSNRELEDLLGFACRLADLAAAEILPHFRARRTIESKQGDSTFDPVTAADRAAERIMRDEIAARYPDDGITGEEFEDLPGQSGRMWVLDPIDGTRSFILGLPIWGTLIGLEAGGKPILGLMNQPFTEERFLGSPDGAEFSRGGKTTKLETSARSSLDQAFLAATDPEMFKRGQEKSAFGRLAKIARATRYGGDCYFYCQLAAGQIDLVVEAGLHPYDIKPLIPIVEGAGGVVTDWQGNSARGGGRVIAAANMKLHKSALEVLNA